MSIVDTLKSGTIISAELCGVSDEYGQIKENYIADILVLNENPLNNLITVFDPLMVFKNGIKFNEQLGLNSFEDVYLN